jgi:hypothetical protein
MAHETLLRLMVNGLQNLAADQQTLGEHLNLRALVYGFDETFEGAPYDPPVPPYPDKVASQAQAADLVAAIAHNSALFAAYLGGTPTSPIAFDGELDEPDLLRLIIDWGTVQISAQKAILQLYGPQPGPPPSPTNPGAASEERLWAEIVAWLGKIAADSNLLSAVQHIETEVAPKGDGLPPLARMERSAQETTLYMLQIAGRLPYHLLHAARAVPPGGATSQPAAAVARAKTPRPRTRGLGRTRRKRR